ncbi:MAG: DNA polymerase III subunit gamma/tau [Oscillospiraceae bacterium]|nr:DNA polymerase III subunit gamma/tau [Oscillospiraceae bacterium]
MYQALYRKYRPATFDEVVGQGHITETLKKQVASGRLSHAYLFTGTRGTGKTSCAKILAKAVNCASPVNGNPCGRCAACRGIDEGTVMDVVEMDAASNNGVDSVRALRDEAIFSPAEVKKRVYIVDEVHMLSNSAFNALLKILEEPPEHLMFILATTELHKVPATILSRCQRHSFRRLDTASIAARLKYVAERESIDLTDDAAEVIARLAEGGMRDALSLLDQCSGAERVDTEAVYSAMGLAGRRSTAEMLGDIARHNTPAALERLQSLWQDGKDPATLLGELSALQRDVLMTITAPKSGSLLLSGSFDADALGGFAREMSAARLIANIELIQKALNDMKSGQAKTVCELCLITMCEPELSAGLPELTERVAALERAVRTGAVPPAAAQEAAKSEPRKPEPPKREARKQTPPKQTREQPPEPELTPPPPDDDDAPPFDMPEPSAPPPPPQIEPTWGAQPEPQSTASASEPELSTAEPRSTPSAGGTELWEKLKKAMANKIPRGLYAILSDPSQVAAEYTDGGLALSLASDFAQGMLNRPEIVAKLASEAAEIAGKQVKVEMFSGLPQTAQASVEDGADKLDELKRFDIVKFT